MTMAMSALDAGPSLHRVMTWSFAIHAGVLLTLFLVPREWLSRRTEQPEMMTISLGGRAAQPTTGTNPIGGRTIEQAAPPPKRPEPIRPTPKQPPAPVPVKPTPTPPARASTSKPTPPPAQRPPVTGPQVTQGNSPVETGARGQGSGLTVQPGLGTGGETDLKNFCCPEYLSLLVSEIESRWDRTTTGERGVTVIRFEVLRSGQIVDSTVTKTSGSDGLDRLARRALLNARLRPLPAEYTEDRLIIHLEFPYGGQ